MHNALWGEFFAVPLLILCASTLELCTILAHYFMRDPY